MNFLSIWLEFPIFLVLTLFVAVLPLDEEILQTPRYDILSRHMPMRILSAEGVETSYTLFFNLKNLDSIGESIANICSIHNLEGESCDMILRQLTSIVEDNKSLLMSSDDEIDGKITNSEKLFKWLVGSIGNDEGQKSENYLAFYTVLCGNSSNSSVIGNLIPTLPSSRFPCFFFSDNLHALINAREAGWIAQLLEGLPDGDTVVSGLKSKDLKSRPHINPTLSKFRYTVYQDTKITVSEPHALAALSELSVNKSIAMCRHRFFSGRVSVWQDFEEGIKQERYLRQKEKMETYINKKLQIGFPSSKENYLGSRFIVRDMSAEVTREFGDAWHRNIMECGTLCQTSLFFVHQQYDDHVHPLPQTWFQVTP